MLKKIPPKPKDGTLRVHKKFTFRKIATKDEYYARFRFVYHVQRYNDLEKKAQVGPYLHDSGWFHVATFAIKDSAEIFVNMLTLQQENAKYVQNMGITNTIAK